MEKYDALLSGALSAIFRAKSACRFLYVTAFAGSVRSCFFVHTLIPYSFVLIYMAWYMATTDAVSGRMLKILIFLFAAFLSLFIFICFSFLSSAKSHEKLFICLWILLGSVYLFVLPVMSEADSKSHYFRAFDISEGQLVANRDEDGNASGDFVFPAQWTGSSDDNVRLSFDELSDYADYSITQNEATHYTFNNTALYSPFSYLPQVLGILIGRFLSDKLIVILYAGRIVNFLLTGLVYWMAVRIMPFSKKYIICAALMPMSLHQSVSLSPDSMVCALVTLLLACVCYLRFTPKSTLSTRMIVLLYLVSFFLSQYKIVYVAACLMLFLIPKDKFKNHRNYWIHVSLLGTMILASSLGWLHIASQNMLEQYADSHGQIMVVLKEPVYYLIVLVRTFYKKGLEYLNQMLGLQMGAFLIQNDSFLIYVATALFILLPVVQKLLQRQKGTHEKEQSSIRTDKGARINLLFVSALTILLICTSEYIQWTNYRESTVNGVQGRYFLPLLVPIAVAALGLRPNDLQKEYSSYAVLIGLNLCIALNVGVSFLFLTGSHVLY